MHHRWWIATVACAAVAVLCFFYLSKCRPGEKEVLTAEDEVYEAVVRDMITQPDGQVRISQLVFGDAVLTDLRHGVDIDSCKERVRKRLRLEVTANDPPFNSLADKVYRVLTGGSYDDSLRADTIQDFLEKSCTAGHLSQTFHTDLPRTFVPAESVNFDGWPVEKNGPQSFEQVFPGASGIISFSHVGFDSTLHEAIVSTAFVCGMLCGSGSRYVLRKKWGRWEVVNKLVVWVS